MEEFKRLSDRIYIAMRLAHVSDAQVAKALGISKTTWFERKKHPQDLRLSELYQLERLFKCDHKYLILDI